MHVFLTTTEKKFKPDSDDDDDVVYLKKNKHVSFLLELFRCKLRKIKEVPRCHHHHILKRGKGEIFAVSRCIV